MTPNLLDELEKIVALSEKATDGPFMVDEYADVTANGEDVARIVNCDADAHLIALSVNFLRTHAPALADMAKRMEAAERDAYMAGYVQGCNDQACVGLNQDELRDDAAKAADHAGYAIDATQEDAG